MKKNSLFKHPNGQIVVVDEFGMMRSRDTQFWEGIVVYRDIDTDQVYTRAYDEFTAHFKPYKKVPTR